MTRSVSRIIAACLLVAGGNILCSRRAESQTAWGLAQRDSFVVSQQIVKQTSLQLDDQAPVESATNDQIDLEYSVLRTDRNGGTLFLVQIVDARRGAAEPDPMQAMAINRQLESLKDARFQLIVPREGPFDEVRYDDVKLFSQIVSGVDPAAEAQLSDWCTPTLVESWLATPFWLGFEETAPDPAYEWLRTETTSLGAFGTCHVVLSLQLQPATETHIPVKIYGTGHFIPAPQSNGQTPVINVNNVEWTVDSYTGTAEMALPVTEPTEATDTPNDALRPTPTMPSTGHIRFRSVNTTIKLHGKATITIEGVERRLAIIHSLTRTVKLKSQNVTGGLRPQPLRFFPE